jgi:PAS domain S-box-containing protein
MRSANGTPTLAFPEPGSPAGAWQALVEAQPAIVWTATADGALNYLNGRSSEYLGAARERGLGWGWEAVLHPDDRAAYVAAWKRALRTAEPYEAEFRQWRASDRSYRWHVARAVPVRDAAGDVVKWVGVTTDVDDLKRAGEERDRLIRELRAERAKLAEVFAHASAFICTLRGADHVFESANPMFHRMIGPRELIGRPVREALPEVEGQGFFERLDEVYRTGEPFTAAAMPLTLRLDRPGGPPCRRYVSVVYQAMRDGDGRITGVLAHGVDVTEQKLAESALSDSERRLRALIDHAPACIYYKDTQGRVLDVNRGWADLVGVPVDQVRGRPETDFFPADVVERFAAADRRVLAECRPLLLEEQVPRGGDARTYSSVKFPLVDERGAPYAVCGISMDVTEQRRAERALRESEERLRGGEARLRELADAMPQMVWVTRGDGDQESFNRRWCEYTGTTFEQAVGEGWTIVLHPDDAGPALAKWKRSLRTGEPFEVEYRLRRASDGAYRWHLGRAVAVRDSAGHLVRWIGTCTDIEERKAAERALRLSEERYRLASQAVSDVIWDWDMVTDRLHWGEGVRSIFGYGTADVGDAHQWWEERIHPDDRERVAAGFQRVVDGGATVWTDEYRFRLANDSYAVVQDRAHVRRDPDGKPERMIGAMQDVTERRRAEEALQRSEEMLRRVFDSSADCIKTLDLDGRVLSMNACGLRLMEIEDFASTANADWAGFWRGADRTSAEQALATAKAGGVGRFEGFCPTAQGAAKWWHVVVSPIADAAGRTERLLAVSRDVTERHDADEMLRFRNALLRAQSEASPDGILVVSPEGRVVSFNQRFVDLWRIPRSVIDAGNDEASLRVAWERVADEQFFAARTRFFYEHPDQGGADEIRLLDGRILDRYTAPLRGEDGTLYGRLWCFRDITERRRAEEARETLASIVACSHDAVFSEDLDGTINSWNGGAERMFGRPAAEVVGRRYPGLVPPDRADELQRIMDAVRRGERVEPFETERLHRDGSRVCVSLSVSPIFDPRRRVAGVSSIARDVTEQRRAAELERERNGLRDAVRALNRVLGVVGHELRTPIAATRATAEFLLMQGQLSGEAEAMVVALRDEVVRMSGTVNDLLEVARINSGTARWNWGTVAVPGACEEAAATVRPLLDGRPVTLTVAAEPPGLVMRGDVDGVRRLVLNLLSNAQKHTAEGRIDVRARPYPAAVGTWVEIEVCDTGIGMPPERAAKLGQAFALNSGVVGDDHVAGTGLGLAICRGIVAAHGGRIEVESAVGRGTRVTVLLRADLAGPSTGDVTLRVVNSGGMA